MATITVQVDDAISDGLQAMAALESQTLSDFTGQRLQEVVLAFREGPEGLERDSLTALERHTLTLLDKILACVLPQDVNGVDVDDREYQPDRVAVLERDFAKECPIEFVGLQ